MTLFGPQGTQVDYQGLSLESIGNSSLWGIPEIATFLNKGQSTARKYAADPEFPLPVLGAQRDRRWFPDEVITYFRTSRKPVSQPLVANPTQLIPHRITTKPKKEKVA